MFNSDGAGPELSVSHRADTKQPLGSNLSEASQYKPCRRRSERRAAWYIPLRSCLTCLYGAN